MNFLLQLSVTLHSLGIASMVTSEGVRVSWPGVWAFCVTLSVIFPTEVLIVM